MPEDDIYDGDEEIGYAEAAPLYWEKGWRGILPLRPKQKFPPPDGYTGHTGIDPSYPDICAWSDEYPNGNLCLRMPIGLIGIDIDAYGGKTGAQTLAEAERRWGPLPETFRSTSRMATDKISGIRYFRVPAGTVLVGDIKFPELGIGHIEIIQRHHRYSVSWPSFNKDSQSTYYFYNGKLQNIGLPSPDEAETFPTRWIEELQINYANRNEDLGENEANDLIKKCLTEGSMSPKGRQQALHGDIPAAKP